MSYYKHRQWHLVEQFYFVTLFWKTAPKFNILIQNHTLAYSCIII